jgi:hypothetical protein
MKVTISPEQLGSLAIFAAIVRSKLIVLRDDRPKIRKANTHYIFVAEENALVPLLNQADLRGQFGA